MRILPAVVSAGGTASPVVGRTGQEIGQVGKGSPNPPIVGLATQPPDDWQLALGPLLSSHHTRSITLAGLSDTGTDVAFESEHPEHIVQKADVRRGICYFSVYK